jgi:hypothetical protein
LVEAAPKSRSAFWFALGDAAFDFFAAVAFLPVGGGVFARTLPRDFM